MKKFFLAVVAALALFACSEIPGTGASRQGSPSPSVSPSPEATEEPASTDAPSSTTPPPAGSYTISVTINERDTSTSSNKVYCAWMEAENGVNLKNLYVCDKMVFELDSDPNNDKLNGDALPNWLKKKYQQHKDVDGITGSSDQGSNTLISFFRNVELGTTHRFRICFEIDRSWNGNGHFTDRPAFTYSTDLIDIVDLESSYALSVSGWMSNSTDSGSLSQKPSPVPTDYAIEKFMPASGYLDYITDGNGTADMVISAFATVVKN